MGDGCTAEVGQDGTVWERRREDKGWWLTVSAMVVEGGTEVVMHDSSLPVAGFPRNLLLLLMPSNTVLSNKYVADHPSGLVNPDS